jgi:hypothetical protein
MDPDKDTDFSFNIYSKKKNNDMKHIKTFESYSLNENWIGDAWNWIKERLSSWISSLTGDFKEGAEYAMTWIKDNYDMMKETVEGLRQVTSSEIDRLFSWVKSLASNTDQMIPAMESVEESRSILDKIARISGASIVTLSCFAGPVAALAGLIMSNGVLFLAGAVAAVIAWSIVSAMGNE